MKESIVEGLKKLGLTEYEARAYAALVGLGEATAREIHEASGVPRTRIYDILRDLAEKGFVEFIQGSPTYYRVVEPESVVERLRHDLLEAIDLSERELKGLNLEVQGSSPVWCVRSEWAIKNRIRDFLGTVDKDLTIFCRNPDFLEENRSEIKRYNLRIIVDNAERFEGLGLELELKSLRGESARLFQDMEAEEASFILDCAMIKRGKESLVIGRMGRERLAIIIKIPLLTMIQMAFLDSLV
jgi:sugar-specific transcriptional regulator TrmB